MGRDVCSLFSFTKYQEIRIGDKRLREKGEGGKRGGGDRVSGSDV